MLQSTTVWYDKHGIKLHIAGRSIMLSQQPIVFWIICVLVISINLQFSIRSITAANKLTWCDNSSTCSFEVSTQLQPLPDTALRMWRKCFLNIIHLNPTWQISALPEKTIYEHLQWTYSITTVSRACHGFAARNKEQYLHNWGLLPGKSNSHSQSIKTSSEAHPAFWLVTLGTFSTVAQKMYHDTDLVPQPPNMPSCHGAQSGRWTTVPF